MDGISLLSQRGAFSVGPNRTGPNRAPSVAISIAAAAAAAAADADRRLFRRLLLGEGPTSHPGGREDTHLAGAEGTALSAVHPLPL